MTPAELRRKSADARKKAKALVDLAATEDRELSADENEILTGLKADQERYERQATMLETLDVDPAPTPRTTEPPATREAIEPGPSEADKLFSFRDFLACVVTVSDRKASRETAERAQDRLNNLYGTSYRSWTEGANAERRDMLQASGTTGGYLVPTQFYNSLMSAAEETAIVRPRAMVLPMGADTVEIPILNQTTAPSAGNTAFFGGLTATWSAEAASITEVQPTFRQAKLTAHELTGYTEVSRTLLQNSAVSIDPLLNRLFGGAIAWYEDYAFLRGDGVGKPLGVQNSAAFIANGTARGSATAISLANAASVYAKLLPSSMPGAVWVASQGALTAILTMAGVSNGVILPAGFYSNTGATPTPALTLMGKPVLISEKLPALNTAGDFGLYDFSQYIVGDRQTLEIATSEHFKFQNNMMAFRFVHRVGGMPWMDSYITLSDASTTVSPFAHLTVQ